LIGLLVQIVPPSKAGARISPHQLKGITANVSKTKFMEKLIYVKVKIKTSCIIQNK
jgi:hypothetical protein